MIGGVTLNGDAMKADASVDIEKLEKNIKKDIKNGYFPIGLIGIAGTTNTGSIDPLKKLGLMAKKYNLWYRLSKIRWSCK